ncbi:M28 family peptidase [Lysinibacillus pakistanensis]|uniref:M28 family peptidase n=1 Tax=Lysinibacillus pakistanensis TaxID=759811 RepID=A0AAX3WP88_9BACI|nr:M28 family peptidase [Lysinibacillus pakistanensis]MDM5233982.1 M28 family peptidase [Lysinibacillus pakistanensis]WHY44588.1 M28 family peptidase [Lysinibacillus pakistanensis]WHY49596.1 M28 family peptidase [Lysinibacillus pakistanensis]
MEKRKLLIFAILLALLTSFISFSQFLSPSQEEVGETEKDFSSDRALNFLKEVAKEPHPIGSSANKKVRDYIVKHFQDLDIPVEIQSKPVKDIRDEEYAKEIGAENVENIIAKIQGTSSDDNAILLTAHYDSEIETPGASDDGYGVVTIMEAARALKQMSAPKNTIYFVLTDGEEPGLLGARALQDRADILDEVRVMLNFEARGNTGVPIMFETSSNDLRLAQFYKETVPYPVAYSFASEMYKKMPNDTDFTELKITKKLGYNFANMGGLEAYHAVIDRVENSDEETIRHFGDYALPLVKRFMMMDVKEFQALEDSKGNAIYFPIMKKVLVVYSEKLVIPLMVVLLILTVAIFFFSFNKQVTQIKGLIFSLIASIGSLVSIFIFYFLLIRLLTIVFNIELDEDGIVMFGTYNPLILTLLMLLAIVLTFFLAKWVSKKSGTVNFAISTQVLWMVLAVITSLTFKGISYAFTIPAIISLLLILPIIGKAKWAKGVYHYVVVAGWTVSSILLLGPIMYLIFIAKTITIAPIITVVTALITFSIVGIVNWLTANDGKA